MAAGGSARGLGALTSENSFQLQIRAERKHLPVSYLLPNVNTQYPDRARPTANTPAQSSYYYNPLALCILLVGHMGKRATLLEIDKYIHIQNP